jgi:hypothetical protein
MYANINDTNNIQNQNSEQNSENNSYISQFNSSNILNPQPSFTKQTRCNNNFNVSCYRDDFFRPHIRNIGTPINSNHEHYMLDMNAQSFYDIERSGMCTRNNNNNLIQRNTPVQNAFQNNYHTMQFDNQTHDNNEEVNKFLTRNPVNTKRDDLEKSRNLERQNFLKTQGGTLSNYNDFKIENTRKGRTEINSNNYIPMPRTLAIPKDNI